MKKLKLFVLITVLTFTANWALAQYDKGDKIVNAGVGLNTYYSGGLLLGSSFEYGITDAISAGVGMDFLASSYTNVSSNYNVFYLGARGSYHVNKLFNIDIEKLDLYCGASLGYRFFSWRDNFANQPTNRAYGNSLYVGGHAGARYYFIPTFGAYAEVGVNGAVNSTVGLTFRF